MAFVSDLVDQLRDILDDAADSQVSYALKKLYLNRGIARMWPAIQRISSTDVSLLEGVYDYDLTTTISAGHIVSVERETEEGSGEFVRYNDYDLIQGDEDEQAILRLTAWHPGDGVLLRVRYAAPIPLITAATYAAAQSETWLGPDRAMGLPVLYAAGMIALRRVDGRQDYTAYSTTQALNGVTDGDIMESARMWLGQFELELDRLERPLPIARD